MRRLASRILTGLIAGVITFGPLAAAAEEAVTPVAVPSVQSSVVTAIRRAEVELQARLAAAKKAGTLVERLPARPDAVEVTLAVWCRETDAIRYLRVTKTGDDLTLLEGDLPLPKVTVSARQNSQYEFADRSEAVVGVIYPVATAVVVPVKAGSQRKKTVYDVVQTYLVPTSRDVAGPEVIAAGSDYLSNRIQLAIDELRDLGVKSQAYPDRLLADVADPYLTKTIVIIEHSSHVALLSDFHPEKEVGEFLEFLGRNGDDSFDRATSSAGATGLAQFIPSTYNLLVRQRPELKLIKDFKAGMADHHNALKAEIAYLDECLADMPRDVRTLARLEPLYAAQVAAASYNGGSLRVRRAIATWGDAWNVRHTNKKGVTLASSIRTETYWYIAKLKAVYLMLQGGYYATPTAPANALPVTTPATVAGDDGANDAAATDADDAPSLAPATAAGTDTTVICFDGDVCS